MDTLRILGYERLETLYETGWTFVCRAQNEVGEPYLLKAMKNDQPTPEQLTRFEYEYTILSALNLPEIPVRDLIKHYKGHVMIMEDQGGIPLKDAPIFRSIQQGSRHLSSDKFQWILEIFIKMAEIIGKLHDRNLIHKDINPANFLVLPDFSRVNMVDFGLATKTDYSGSEPQHAQATESPLSYISPEQTGRTERPIDYRTDFYSLGVSMYELLTGQKPFAVENPIELVYLHLAGSPVAPHALNIEIPETVSAIIMRLMEKDPEQRYQSAAGIVQDLRKCLEGLHKSGVIEPFELGLNDVSSRFKIPLKLYGRETESEKLKQLYSHVADGAVRMLVVGGYAGVGKTSLINDVCNTHAEFGRFFASGKAEQFQRNTPYYVFAQALKDLVEKLLQEPDAILEQWKDKLLKALKDNGFLITDMVPELIALIGPQVQVSELGPAENRNRLLYTFGSFIKVFARKNHPLTLFLDDLQWTDRPSMELIEYLANRDDLESFMMICSYRDNELSAGHPLHLLLDGLLKSEKTVALPLKPISQTHVSEMLADVLNQKSDRIQTLAGIVHKKTQGNPFFVRKLLYHLYDGNYIRFNEEIRQWEWDVKQIDGTDISDNIVDFMVDQLLKLAPETQEMLKLAALFGSTFNLESLAAVARIPQSEVAARLNGAFESEIILTKGSEYAAKSLRFAHDKVQQACVALMDAPRQRELHLQIGRTIKLITPEEEWPENAMEIVSHLNEGLEGIESDEERWETAKLNLWACLKAKASSAYYLALGYIENSARILPENAWQQDYGLAYKIFKTYVECAYLNNEYKLADDQAEHLLHQARTPNEQAEVRLMQSTLFNFQGLLDKAIQYAFLGLKLLKKRMPVAPGLPLVLKEMAAVKMGLTGKSTQDLLNLPPMKNERIKLVLQLVNEINRAAYLIGKTNLFLLSILMRMQLTLRFGNTHEAGNIYVAYSMILAIFGDYPGTYKFCELALLSHEKEESFECRPTTLFSCGFFGHAWNRSWRNIEQWFEESLEEAVKYGDHHTIALAAPFMYAFKPDASLRDLVNKAMKHFPLVRQTNNVLSFNFTFLIIHRWLNYAGLTDGRFTMSVSRETHEKNGGAGIINSEEECLDNLREGNFLSALGVYYKEKAYIHYLYDDYAGALKYIAESDKYLTYHTGTPYIVECTVCNFLVLTANIPTMTEREAAPARRRLRKEYNRVKVWAKHCPVNFEHLQILMEAELARLAHRPYEASDLYDRAIQTARHNGFMRDDALANELAAKMFLGQGKESQGLFYLTEAIKCYKAWGAEAKVSHLAEKYGYLLRIREQPAIFEIPATTDAMDLMSLVSASKAVSEEAQLPNLLKQIMKTVVENSAAQKACMLGKSEHGWRIEAQQLSDSNEAEVLKSQPFEEAHDKLPVSVINYCIHTREPVVLGHAANTGNFTGDRYIQKNQIRSLLCMPIINQGELVGILYLENNLSDDVFTRERVHILQLLAAQFSISIKNVRLFADLFVKTEEAHHATEEALRSDIAFLQAQIKPHFLYNALNTISAFSYDDPQLTRDLLANLSQYLRSSFDFKNRDKLVTLRKELEFVEAYLFIEKARYGDRLKVVYDIDADADCVLPPLVIQPLVENAVQHGLSELKKGGTITISIRDDVDHVSITVENDGADIEDPVLEKLFDDSIAGTGGIALKNINKRLLRIYGQGLRVERPDTGGTRCSMRIAK